MKLFRIWYLLLSVLLNMSQIGWMKQGTKAEGETEVKKEEAVDTYSKDQGGQTVCGVMRIGLVAKGLLIKDDMDLELVLMCKDKPTETLLNTVKDNLPIQIQVSTV